MVALLGEAVEPVEGGALQEEAQHWGLAFRVYCLTPLPVCFHHFLFMEGLSSQLPAPAAKPACCPVSQPGRTLVLQGLYAKMNSLVFDHGVSVATESNSHRSWYQDRKVWPTQS